MSHEELNRAPVVEYDRKDFVQDVARALIEKEVGLEAEETFIQSPTIYIPSSPDYARAVSLGIAWGLIPEAQCAEELESGHLVKLAATPRRIPPSTGSAGTSTRPSWRP